MKGDRLENNFPIKQEVNEPNEAFSACIFYVRMGTGRTFNEAYRKYTPLSSNGTKTYAKAERLTQEYFH